MASELGRRMVLNPSRSEDSEADRFFDGLLLCISGHPTNSPLNGSPKL